MTASSGFKPDLKARLAVLYYVSTFPGALWLFIFSIWLSWRFWWPTLVFIPYYIFSFSSYNTGPIKGNWPKPLRDWSAHRALARYFGGSRIVKTADLDPSQTYIFCAHPHGILTFGAWLTFCCHALGFDKLFPGLDVRVLTVSVNFRVPLFREYLLLHGICDVGRRACATMLSRGKSILIVPGGAAESLISCPGGNDLVLRRRKGFVRMALRSGASLVPVYLFGETSTFSTLTDLPSDSLFRRVQDWMRKSWGWTVPISWGRGLFLPVGLLPYPVTLTPVIGAPIEVPKYTGDFDSAEFTALVDKHHQRYMDAVSALFNAHREKFAKGEQELRIVE